MRFYGTLWWLNRNIAEENHTLNFKEVTSHQLWYNNYYGAVSSSCAGKDCSECMLTCSATVPIPVMLYAGTYHMQEESIKSYRVTCLDCCFKDATKKELYI